MKILLYLFCLLTVVYAVQGESQIRTYRAKRWSVVEQAACNVTCLNGGYCSPDSNQCICTPNCRGVSCEKCSWNIPFGMIVAFLAGLVIVWYVCIWVADLITRKCRWATGDTMWLRFYRRVAVHDPFVDNLQSISASASHQNSTAGDKYMSPSESPTPRWYRNHWKGKQGLRVSDRFSTKLVCLNTA